MSKGIGAPSPKAVEAKNKLVSQFFKRGITIGLMSGLLYGLFSAFLTLAMTKGVWSDWYGANSMGLSSFVVIFVLGALGSAVNDLCSAVFAVINVSRKGKLGDFFRTLNSTPGRMLMLAALLGGPIANVAYVVAIQLAGSLAIPVTALCPAIGAILGRIIYKQELNKRMALGILICVSASITIGSAGITGDAPAGFVAGLLVAFVAALGWGFEGVIAGYGSSMIDSEIGITIRQSTSGLANVLVLIPLLSLIEGDITLGYKLVGAAFTSGEAMIWFAVSGFVAFVSFMYWYKATSMTGAALGMATNGTYSFFGPLCCWVILGVIFGIDGWELSSIQLVAATVMAVGILIISTNPLEFFAKKEVTA